MNNTLQSRFTAEFLAHSFPDISKLQEFLTSLTYDRARKMGKNFHAMAGRERENSDSRLKNRKNELETDIMVLKEHMTVSQPEASNFDELKHKVYMKERELEHINRELQKPTATEASKEWLAFEEIEAAVKLIDLLANHVIDWFKTGHLGPGTVEYNGMKFTAE